MIRKDLAQELQAAIAKLPFAQPANLAPVEIQDSKQPEHGDYATNWAMVSSKAYAKNPRELAEALVSNIEFSGLIASADIAGPGFVNLKLNPVVLAKYVAKVDTDEFLDSAQVENKLKINVEFVSVNPNGPITIGSGRGAAFGSTLCNVLEAVGHEVHREYYLNDGVNSEQMRLFAESVRALILGRPVPENGYKGDYVQDVSLKIGGIGRTTLKTLPHGDMIGAQDSHGIVDELTDKNVYAERIAPIVQKYLTASSGESVLLRDHVDKFSTHELQTICEVMMADAQRANSKTFGVTFDTWFSEQSLHDNGKVIEEVKALKSANVADEQPYRTKLKLAKGGVIEEVEREDQPQDEDDATGTGPTLWLRSTKFGDDMDRVLRRKDGRLTYIASDVAYHKDKFSRPPNADKLITILGPDHHGYIGRLHAVLAAVLAEGIEVIPSTEPLTEIEAKLYATSEERDKCKAALENSREKLEVLIYQFVRFIKDGKPAPMRKRDGNLYALIDLIDEIGKKAAPDGSQEEQRRVGKDVARFFYLMRHHDTTFDFDLDLAERQSDDNPVYYVQYAHARISSIITKALEEKLEPSTKNLELLVDPRETALIKKICDLPVEIARAAEDYGVHRLATYSTELAKAFHYFYDGCRVIQADQPELSRARLALCAATSHTLRKTLEILGISAPTTM